MSKQIISTEKAPAAIGPYSQAVQHGDTIYVSGQLPLNPETKKMDDDVSVQTEQSMNNIKAIFARGWLIHGAGASVRDFCH